MSSSLALATAVTFVWLGMVLAIAVFGEMPTSRIVVVAMMPGSTPVGADRS